MQRYYDYSTHMEQLAMERIVCTYLRESCRNIDTYLKLGYLTINTGRDGKTYAWYVDDNENVICDIETLSLCDDDAKIDALLC